MNIHEIWASDPWLQTDKGKPDHAFCGQTYLHHYERHFEPMRDREIKVLEIGVHGGHSLRLWKAYFPKAQIIGMDINPDCKQFEEDRIKIYIGDQSNTEDLTKVAPEQPFDIIVDDGSHCVQHILISTTMLWCCLKSGGWYVWEDMGISYTGVSGGWPGMHLNSELPLNNRSLVDRFLAKHILEMDNLRGEIQAIHFYPMIDFLHKA